MILSDLELPSPFLEQSILSPTCSTMKDVKRNSICDKDEKTLSVFPQSPVRVGSPKTVLASL
jgi:hypothetical protein